MIPHVKTDHRCGDEAEAGGRGLDRAHRTASPPIANKAGLFGFHEAGRFAAHHHHPHGRWLQFRLGGAAFDAALGDRQRANWPTTAIEKCARWKNPQQLEPGNYTVVLEPTAAGDLVRLMAAGFSARNTEEGRTFLSKRGGGTLLGEKCSRSSSRCAPIRSIRASLRRPGPAICCPRSAITWIDKGVVANLAYDRYWADENRQDSPRRRWRRRARRWRRRRFGGGGGSLILEGGDAPLDQLIASVERGLLVTHFWYIRGVNQQTLQQTGLTRDGVVPDRERQDHHAGDELPLPRKPGAAAEEHEDAGPGACACAGWKAA